jgi:hypothetical protein
MILSTAVAAAATVYVVKRAQARAQDELQEECLDTALADTFPASDPLPFSATQPARPAPSMRS